MRPIILVLLALTIFAPVYAEEPQGKAQIATWADRLSLRQSELDKNAIEKPATLQFVHSSSKGDSYAIDAGLTISVYETDRWFIGPLVEYHRKTETSKEQNNFQAGLTVINIYGDVSEGHALYTQGSLKYVKDKITAGEGLLTKINVTPLYPDWWMGSARKIGLLDLKVIWQPTVGVQYETTNNVLKTGEHGSAARAFGSIEVGIYPFAEALRSNLEIVVRNNYWRNINQTGGYKSKYDQDHNLFQTGLTYYFDSSRHFGIGIDYSEGENPEEGLLEQANTILSLRLKF